MAITVGADFLGGGQWDVQMCPEKSSAGASFTGGFGDAVKHINDSVFVRFSYRCHCHVCD